MCACVQIISAEVLASIGSKSIRTAYETVTIVDLDIPGHVSDGGCLMTCNIESCFTFNI